MQFTVDWHTLKVQFELLITMPVLSGTFTLELYPCLQQTWTLCWVRSTTFRDATGNHVKGLLTGRCTDLREQFRDSNKITLQCRQLDKHQVKKQKWFLLDCWIQDQWDISAEQQVLAPHWSKILCSFSRQLPWRCEQDKELKTCPDLVLWNVLCWQVTTSREHHSIKVNVSLS